MTGTTIAPVFQIAPRTVAAVLGLPMAQYRPSSAGAVIAGGNLLRTLPVWITGDKKGMGTTPFDYEQPVAYASVDPALTSIGDDLVGAIWPGGTSQTFFISSMDLPAPIQVVNCNRVLTFSRPSGQNPGPSYYGGDIAATETPLLTAWPAAVAAKGKRQSGEVRLPGDMDLPWYEILLPPSVPVQLLSMDVVMDDQAIPVRYVVSETEQTTLGWRLSARAAVP